MKKNNSRPIKKEYSQSIPRATNVTQTGNINIYNALNVSPKQIKLYALTDIKWLNLWFRVMIIILAIAVIGIIQEHNIPISISLPIGIIFIIALIFCPKILEFYNYKNKKFRSEYCDGIVTLRSHKKVFFATDITYKFYEDIWKIEHKTNFFDNGVLSFYLIDRKDHKPIKKVIIFKSAAETCYIYDSFYDQERIKAFLEQKDQSTTSI